MKKNVPTHAERPALIARRTDIEAPTHINGSVQAAKAHSNQSDAGLRALARIEISGLR